MSDNPKRKAASQNQSGGRPLGKAESAGQSRARGGLSGPGQKKIQSRWYLLRTGRAASEEMSLYLFGGLSEQREKPLAQIKSEAEKAFRAGYQKILLPWNFVFHSEAGGLLRMAKAESSKWAFQVHSRRWREFKKKSEEFPNKFPGAGAFPLTGDLIFEGYDPKALAFMESFFVDFQITLPARRGLDLKALLKSLPEKYRPRLHIHFPCFHKKHPQLLSSGEMYELLKEKFYPPPLIDIFNLSIPEDLKLEPEIAPDIGHALPSSDISVSIVIPSYNSGRELLLSLRHLAAQNLPKEKWEAIVVDDGSSDKTLRILRKAAFLPQMNFKYIYFPRVRKRRGLGDHRFRAGLARNLGAKHAQGRILAFLDSDILTPPHYLRSISEKLRQTDIIQHPRLHLKKRAPRDFAKIDRDKHTFIKGDGYWEDFYNSPLDWNKREKPWKFLSTNTLCLKTASFRQAGWFRKNYTCYGFEDTDLGWRLCQMGRRFHLNPIETYHLRRPSEFWNFHFIKQHLLGQAANIFFHNTHSIEAYEEFRHLIQKRGL